jgi:hypothetical protein
MDSLPEAGSGGIESHPAGRACLRDSHLGLGDEKIEEATEASSTGADNADSSNDRSEGAEEDNNNDEAEHTTYESSGIEDDVEAETGDIEDNHDNEVSDYMERLISTHLKSVMENHPMVDISIPERFIDESRQSVMVSMIVTALEQDSNIVLAHLLKAAIRVHRTDQDGVAAAIDHLFQETIRILLSQKNSGEDVNIALLQTVLEELIRCDASDSDMSSPEHASDSHTVSNITVCASGSTKEVAFEDILSCFWSSKLETVCHECHQSFNSEPPIRTIAQDGAITQISSSLRVRVFNRHFACLKTKETFMVPVSHVWEDSIRTANESKTHNDDAASTLIRTLRDLFEGAENAYGPEVEFWHDYFSVPQWEPKTKESLLLCLPAIYSSCDEILVHMSDLPTASAKQLLFDRDMGEGIPIWQAIQRIPPLSDLSKSQWMQRMWVTLEYSQAKAACVMDQSNTIWRNKEVENRPFACNTFTRLLNGGSGQLIGMYRWAKTFSQNIGGQVDSLILVAMDNMQGHQLCLGEVMELVSKKQCQVLRDRFLAMHIILNPNPALSEPSTIPGTDTDACSWVWRGALSRGDYSPLLLQPKECIPSSNPEPPLPSWLVGCRGLDGAEWGFGNQETALKEIPVVAEMSVKVGLNQVGEIRAIHYLNTQDLGEVKGVNEVIQILVAIARTEGLQLSPKDLYNGIDRVFPSDRISTRVVQGRLNMVFSFNERQMQDPDFSTKLSEHLDLYAEASDVQRKAQVLDAAQSITTLLQLDKNIISTISTEVTRLTRSSNVARRRKARGAVKGEPLCEVRCPRCHKVTLLRLDLRITGNVGDIVYRIPGLSYSQSVDDGVGLVLRDRKITGRMFYGKPECDCQLQETVIIW